MVLVGQYELAVYPPGRGQPGCWDFDFEHDARSVFADFDSMRTTNPWAGPYR